MKKTVSLIVALVLIFAMSVPAFAAAADNVATHAGCPHSVGTYSKTQIIYTSRDETYHNKYRVYVYYCKSCGKEMYRSEPELLDTERHTHGSGTYVSSTHIGDYTTHYYTYKGNCTVCSGRCTWTMPAACRAGHCVDPK